MAVTLPLAGTLEGKRGLILEAALSVLKEGGVSGLKMEEVARRAGVAKGTLYLYFQNKRDLLKALVEERTWGFYREVEAIVRRDAPFFERLEDLLRRRLAWIQEWRGLWAAVAREAMGQEDPTPWLKGLHEHYLALLEELVLSGQAEGSVRRDLNPRAAAAVVSALGCTPSLEVEAYMEHLLLVFQKGVAP